MSNSNSGRSTAEVVVTFSFLVSGFLSFGLALLTGWFSGADQVGAGIGFIAFPLLWMFFLWLFVTLSNRK